MDERINYVCKICGRAIRSPKKPTYCYFCKSTSIENISDDDSHKMGLFLFSNGVEINLVRSPEGMSDTLDLCVVLIDAVTIEFPADMRYHPFKGSPLVISEDYLSLIDFQENIMSSVRDSI